MVKSDKNSAGMAIGPDHRCKKRSDKNLKTLKNVTKRDKN